MTRLRALCVFLIALVAGLVAAGAGCSGKTTTQGGLMLVVRTDGSLPQATRLHIGVSSSDGTTTYRNADYAIPSEVTLPTTLGIATNGSSTASVSINVSLWAGDTLLDDRENQVFEIPVDRVAELDIVLSAKCTALAVVEDGGAGSSCTTGDTCDPATGKCTGDTVNGGQLPTFEGDAGSNVSSDAGGAGDATLGAGDAGPGDAAADGSEAAPPMIDGGIIVVSPATITLAETLGSASSIPTQQFIATYNGVPIPAQFTIDKAMIGSVGAASGLFTAGNVGGVATITAQYEGAVATATVTVNISYVSAGDPNAPDAGNLGGVGGSPEGSPASPSQITVLNGTPTSDSTVTFLYPYDKTVFPQGLLPPLLQWTYGSHSFDGIYIHFTEAYYEYKGYFMAPATPFQNHPIPQAIWSALVSSNAGEPVSVQLTFSQGVVAYGPISETWTIAPGAFPGTIFYTAYATQLVSNFCCTYLDDAPFGAAVLTISGGAPAPVLAAGTNNAVDEGAGCRACHSAAAGGSALVVQHGDSYATSSAYTFPGDTETVIANNNGNYTFTEPAITPDGTMMFTGTGSGDQSATQPSGLYDMTGNPIDAGGIPSGLQGFSPVFSPDGAHVAFNFYAGTGADQASIASLDFANATKTFSNSQILATPPDAGPGYWPSFLPTSDGVIYEVQTVYNGRDIAGDRSGCDGPTGPCHSEGAHGQLWWVDTATKTPTPLDALNGIHSGASYLPPHPTYTGGMGDDTTLNFGPSVSPVTSGGYAWVVFTSRRLYGNVATINPYWSDPRYADMVSTVTPKKLWVAAIDLHPTPGVDPSHPAFYLPGQELFAANGHPQWTMTP